MPPTPLPLLTPGMPLSPPLPLAMAGLAEVAFFYAWAAMTFCLLVSTAMLVLAWLVRLLGRGRAPAAAPLPGAVARTKQRRPGGSLPLVLAWLAYALPFLMVLPTLFAPELPADDPAWDDPDFVRWSLRGHELAIRTATLGGLLLATTLVFIGRRLWQRGDAPESEPTGGLRLQSLTKEDRRRRSG